jgi:hypothetical protein
MKDCIVKLVIFVIMMTLLVSIHLIKIYTLPFLFIHVPKTGGNAIKNTKFFKDSIYFFHTSINDVIRKGKKYKSSYTIVRNPYDRLVSAFFYLQDGGMKNVWDIKSMKKQQKYKNNFKEFVKNLHKFINDTHYKPQYTFLSDENNNIKVTHILKQESLNDDYIKLQQMYGYSPVSIKKINISNHEDYNQYYDEETKQLVKEFYQKDFKLLNYQM